MSSSTDNASSVTASQPKGEDSVPAGTSSGAATAQQDPKPECDDPKQAKVLEQLLNLYRTSSYDNHYATHILACWNKFGQMPDKNDIDSLIVTVQELHEAIKQICKEAKKANPELKMIGVKKPKHFLADENDSLGEEGSEEDEEYVDTE